MKKFYSLLDNEELIVINPKTNSGLSIKSNNGKIFIEEIHNLENQENLFITSLDYKKFKQYLLFEDYYYQKLNETTDLKSRNKLNKVMDKFIIDLFGKKYYQKNINIVNEEYQVISTFEKN